MSKEIIKDLISHGFTVQEALEIVKEVPTLEPEEQNEPQVEPEENKKQVPEDFKEVINGLVESFNKQVKELNNKLDTSIKTKQAINAKTSNMEINEKKAEDFLGQWLNNGHVINDNKEE